MLRRTSFGIPVVECMAFMDSKKTASALPSADKSRVAFRGPMPGRKDNAILQWSSEWFKGVILS
jgi:hypothetical protein